MRSGSKQKSLKAETYLKQECLNQELNQKKKKSLGSKYLAGSLSKGESLLSRYKTYLVLIVEVV